MASFVLFNYQFSKIDDPIEKDLFGNSPVEMDAETAFPQRQDLFSQLLVEDYEQKRPIKFVGLRGKEYAHQYVIPPMDNIFVLRISNRRTTTLTNINFQKRKEADYPYCIVIIDNRSGIQRLAIESKSRVFQIKTLQNILETALNGVYAMRRFSLHVELAHLQNSADFWSYANDTKKYGAGFYKVSFHLPYINLDRLKKAHQSFLNESRTSFDCKMDIELTANQGANGRVHLDEKDKFQKGLVCFLMEEVGGKNILMYPNNNKKRPLVVGAKSFQTIVIPDRTFDQLVLDAKGETLFGSVALDEIKCQTKKNIG